ncbi:unnamed protein product [Arctia plantaginis]|uniref:Serpin domain-containing protein n=1 Tax=Arctia plantaginis TaxID=874455 RepID=A0A8S1AF87_ARCPL|nr:unnamed protein product [Arctia plantaginis]
MKIYLLIWTLVASLVKSESHVQDVLKNGNDQFSANFLYEVSKDQADKSFVISAYSVLSPLAQLALASVGQTHDEILTAIGMPNDNVTKEVFSDVNTRIQSVKGVELKQANKVYVRDGYNLNQEFAAISRTVFNSEVQNIDFNKSTEAAAEINMWVEANTNNRIKDLVNPSTLTPSTAAVLVNAIFFKGNWQIPFEELSTRDRDFFVTKNKKITKSMMHQTDSFEYGESDELDAKLLEMSYEGGETSFVIVLPKQNDSIESLIEKLKDPAVFPKARSNMYTVDVHVSLPKFKIETTTNLKDVLQKINIKQLFVERGAHLDNLIEGESNLYVSDAIQKAFIEVDEKGTEAAAANKFGLSFPDSVGATPLYQSFDADHPFVFYLMQNDNILFNGVFRS